ncbi:hypothetical protein PMAYCL1PPCAC_19488, partial [Pristionchus mayeri]
EELPDCIEGRERKRSNDHVLHLTRVDTIGRNVTSHDPWIDGGSKGNGSVECLKEVATFFRYCEREGLFSEMVVGDEQLLRTTIVNDDVT